MTSVLLLLALGLAPAPAAPPAAPKPTAALYERLGGQPAIGAVVDEFLKRVALDKRINARFINTDFTALRINLVDFVCAATGGPCRYGGRDMQVAHAGLQVVEGEFVALVEDLAGALAALHVPKPEQGELLGALAPLKPKIVAPPPAAAAEHDPALVATARERVAALRAAGEVEAADLVEAAVAARVRGQRSYAEAVYSAAERLADPGKDLAGLEPLFRAGGPERIVTPLRTMAKDTPPQPKGAAGGSEEDAPDPRPRRASLSGRVRIAGKDSEAASSLVMLTPDGGRARPRSPKRRIIEQRGRQFAPRLLAIPVGSTVAFPNFDPVFHNVYSVSPARSFDLGIYKNGEAREVTFSKEGVIHIACNLHADMAASLVVVGAPHYAVSDASGRFRFRSLAPGRYTLKSVSDRTPESLSRVIDIKPGANEITLDLPAASAGAGTDKFGAPR